MIIGLFLNLGEGFTSLGGQAELMLQANILPYARAFNRVYIFTYTQEKFNLPPNCHLVTPPIKLHRFVYAILLPLIHYRTIRLCQLLRCFQLAGTLPAIISKLLYGSKFVFNYGYDYAAFARIEGRPIQALGFKPLEKIAFRLATGIIFKNRNLLPATRHKPPAKFIYLPNGVDTKKFFPRRQPINRLTQPPVILYVGRLEPQKNLTTLLTAVSQLAFPVKLILVGQGSQRQKLLAQALRLHLNLVIRPTIPHSRLPAVYQAADIFVLPSLIEGSPKVLLEAMACGLPIVGSNVTGIKEILSPQTSLLVSPTVTGLKQGLSRILQRVDLAHKLGQSARHQVVKQYNQTKLIAAEIKFLKSCARLATKC